MKTKILKPIGLMLVLLLFSGSTPLWSQYSKDFYTVKGVVKDKLSFKTLENANISIPGTNVGTVTNANGEFSIKIKDSHNAKTIEVSLIGYSTVSFPVKGEDVEGVKIYLSPKQNILDEVTIYGTDAELLVRKAIRQIGENYSSGSNMLSGFYRETIKKRRSYVNVSEAIVEIYKTPYDQGVYKDLTQIYKGRKLVSEDPHDTVLVKLLGGPNLSIYLDIVKNPDLILNIETLSFYKFKMEGTTMIEDRPHYIISFVPQVTLPYALYFGKLYIDVQNLAFSRAEFSVSMDDRNKATAAILKKKPFGMHFKPEEISFLVTYKFRDGLSHLNYIRSDVRFKCDWKKRLFSTNYTIVSETVITGGKGEDAARIPFKLAFRDNQSLSDKVISFSDPAFWEDYNIIEPDQSLETAVNRLKKEQTK
ncbi:MAG: carboxypeptidase-like regulatory domain-containing protein [Bacteroidales bacterium]